MSQMHPRDALMYWIGDKLPNDQFLLYCFAAPTEDSGRLRDFVARRSAAIDDLRLRAHDAPWDVEYPHWVTREFGDDQLIEHVLDRPTWESCRCATENLLATVLEARVTSWRLHVFRGIRGAPGCEGSEALVVVLQLSHALADGQRAAAIARALFGRQEPAASGRRRRTTPSAPIQVVRSVLRTPVQVGRLLASGALAYRAYRESVGLIERGELAPVPAGRELSVLNSSRLGHRDVRVLVLRSDDLRGRGVTVTVFALTAISVALSRYLQSRGSAVPARLGAEVTVAESGEGNARNRFRNVGVDLFPEEPDLRVRADKIAQTLADERVRTAHPVNVRQRRPLEIMPARMVRGEIDRYEPENLPDAIGGHTVLTSVHRGPADLTLAGGTVRFTAGFPALSPAMGVTHGVYTIGGATTVGVHSSSAAMPDADLYESFLRSAIDEVRAALR